jgi:hypothetical protein
VGGRRCAAAKRLVRRLTLAILVGAATTLAWAVCRRRWPAARKYRNAIFVDQTQGG